MLYRKEQQILMDLKPQEESLSKIARRTDTTFSHVVKLMANFEKCGIVSTNKFGRRRMIDITSKGITAQRLMRELNQLFKEDA